MEKVIKYRIFKTKWGYFGLAGAENALLRTRLPAPDPEKVKFRLLKDLRVGEYDKMLFNTFVEQITAYFDGSYVDFDRDIPIVLDGLSQFAKRVLTACRDIRFGRTISYGRLARKVGKPTAARAVGRVMANNPLPLIIPCHRVTCANGKIGGFSAAGGIKLKQRMIKLEQQALA